MTSLEPESIFTSLRSDPAVGELFIDSSNVGQLYLFRLHHERLLEAAQAFKWEKVVDYLKREGYETLARTVENDILSSLRSNSDTKAVSKDLIKGREFRIRLSVDKNAVVKVEAWPALPVPPTQLAPSLSDTPPILWTAYLDPCSTSPSDLTSYKTSSRKMYDDARARVGIASLAATEEVLIHNPKGEITEASICSVYFLRGGTWITPAASCGGQIGISRRLALREKACVEGVVEKSSLVDGEIVWLSNGVRGFFRARFASKRQ